MEKPNGGPSTCRLWKENAKELEPLARLGLNYSDVVNETLKDHLANYVKKKLSTLQSQLTKMKV